jgi:hypothetical protein
MSSIVINSIPTFLLRKLNPNEISKNYIDGKYKSYTINNIIKSKTDKTIKQTSTTTQVGTHHDNDIYGFKNKNNLQTIATTNCKPYISFISSETGSQIIGGKCKWCLRNFTHQAIGIPIKSIKIENTIVIYFESIACRYGCAYSLWKQKYNRMMIRRDTQFINGEIILKYLYSIQYPNFPPLREASDPDLLKCNGGSLEDNDYDNYNYVYVPTSSYIWAPVKEQHLKIKID